MGLSMALHEEAVLDPVHGHFVNHDLAEYHIAVNADVGEVDISWIDEVDDPHNVLGAKGIGEIGIVGTAAAIGNATGTPPDAGSVTCRSPRTSTSAHRVPRGPRPRAPGQRGGSRWASRV